MQYIFSGCSKSRSANIVHSQNILKSKLHGRRQCRGRRNVINFKTQWICTAQSWWASSFPSIA